MLDALKLNFKSINSEIIDLNFFVTIPSSLVLIFLKQKVCNSVTRKVRKTIHFAKFSRFQVQDGSTT